MELANHVQILTDAVYNYFTLGKGMNPIFPDLCLVTSWEEVTCML